MDMKVFLETYKGAFIRLFCVREALVEVKGLTHYAHFCCDEASSDGHYVDHYVFWPIIHLIGQFCYVKWKERFSVTFKPQFRD